MINTKHQRYHFLMTPSIVFNSNREQMKQRIKVEGSCLDYVWRRAKPIEMKVMQNGLILSFPDSDVLVHWGGWLHQYDDGAWYAEGGER